MIYNITISDSLTCRFSGGIAVPEKFITVFHPDKCIYNDLIMSRFFFFFLWKGTGSQYQIITTWISWTKEHLNTQKKTNRHHKYIVNVMSKMSECLNFLFVNAANSHDQLNQSQICVGKSFLKLCEITDYVDYLK